MDADEYWDDEDADEEVDSKQQEIQKLFSEMAAKAKNSMRYMLLEGFVEPTEDPAVYKYTPEGFVMAHQEYKRLKDSGLL
jgi:hypothetical protein